MARVPLIGRLFWREYLALVASFLLILIEALVRVITLFLPQPIFNFFYNQSKKVFHGLSSGRVTPLRPKKGSTPIAGAHDFVDLCGLHGYYAEEHIVQTKDGYLLGLHRLGWKKGEEGTPVNAGEGSIQKKVVYLHHGLLMNSEVWVCITEAERCLPFQLVEKGYDVWLGNNRGNKYSKKSTKHAPNSEAFWNFSMDEFAFHDIPDSIDYVLETTSQKSLSYIGFSQGTAQAFATLSIHPTLNYKVDVFIALAPAMAPAGLANGIVDAFVKASPQVIFLAFGRRSILSSATLWQQLLYPPIFTRVIDMSLTFLFNWTGRNIAPHQKLAAYPHLYSYTSTKSVVHWFQIIRTKSFQMYDDDVQVGVSIGAPDRYYKVAKFPTRNIKSPIVLVYGGSDSLVDIKVMLKELPRHTQAYEIKHFEHLDFLWAQEVDKLVFPHVFTALEEHAGRDHSKSLKHCHRRGNHLNGISEFSEDDMSSRGTDNESANSPWGIDGSKRRSLVAPSMEQHHRGWVPPISHTASAALSSSLEIAKSEDHLGDAQSLGLNPPITPAILYVRSLVHSLVTILAFLLQRAFGFPRIGPAIDPVKATKLDVPTFMSKTGSSIRNIALDPFEKAYVNLKKLAAFRAGQQLEQAVIMPKEYNQSFQQLSTSNIEQLPSKTMQALDLAIPDSIASTAKDMVEHAIEELQPMSEISSRVEKSLEPLEELAASVTQLVETTKPISLADVDAVFQSLTLARSLESIQSIREVDNALGETPGLVVPKIRPAEPIKGLKIGDKRVMKLAGFFDSSAADLGNHWRPNHFRTKSLDGEGRRLAGPSGLRHRRGQSEPSVDFESIDPLPFENVKIGSGRNMEDPLSTQKGVSSIAPILTKVSSLAQTSVPSLPAVSHFAEAMESVVNSEMTNKQFVSEEVPIQIPDALLLHDMVSSSPPVLPQLHALDTTVVESSSAEVTLIAKENEILPQLPASIPIGTEVIIESQVEAVVSPTIEPKSTSIVTIDSLPVSEEITTIPTDPVTAVIESIPKHILPVAESHSIEHFIKPPTLQNLFMKDDHGRAEHKLQLKGFGLG